MEDLTYYKKTYGRLLGEYHGEHGDFFQKEAEKSLNNFEETCVENGIVKWKSNNQVPPCELLLLWHEAGKDFDFIASITFKEEEYRKMIEDCKAADGVPSEEELCEMRCAFGEGAKVIDVIVVDSFTCPRTAHDICRNLTA